MAKLKKIVCQTCEGERVEFVVMNQDEPCLDCTYIDVDGDIRHSEDEFAKTKTNVKEIKHLITEDAYIAASCDDCTDEVAATYVFKDGVKLEDDEEAFKRAFLNQRTKKRPHT